MPEPKKILVPTDFSKHSRLAVDQACLFARKFDASVTLLHAYTAPTYALPEGYITASPQAMAELLSKTDAALKALRGQCLEAGVKNVDVVITEGPAFAEIVRIARERGSDLIVMGTHGRSGLRHALLGSVTEKVVRKAGCAVLTVRDRDHGFEKP